MPMKLILFIVPVIRAGIEDGEGVGPWEDLPYMAKRRYWAREAGLRDLA